MARNSLERGRHYVYAKEFIRIRTHLEKQLRDTVLVPLEEIDIDGAGR
jgi:hypothetical protein